MVVGVCCGLLELFVLSPPICWKMAMEEGLRTLFGFKAAVFEYIEENSWSLGELDPLLPLLPSLFFCKRLLAETLSLLSCFNPGF